MRAGSAEVPAWRVAHCLASGMGLLVRVPLSGYRGALILTQQVGQLSNVRGNPQRLILGQENSHGTNLRPDPHHHHLARGCLDAEGICEHL